MSDGDDNQAGESMTADDVFGLVIMVAIILIAFSLMDACRARERYLDLRDRLERIEQKR